jgi:hypothetical protein
MPMDPRIGKMVLWGQLLGCGRASLKVRAKFEPALIREDGSSIVLPLKNRSWRVCTYACVRVCMYVCMYVCVHVCVLCINPCTPVRMITHGCLCIVSVCLCIVSVFRWGAAWPTGTPSCCL